MDGDGEWLGVPPTHMHMQAHARMHTHAHIHVKHDNFNCKRQPPLGESLGIPYDVIHTCAYMCHGCGQLYGTSECPSRNSGSVRDSEFTHGVHMTLSSCKQNTNLFGRAGLTTPTRLGFLFRCTFYVTFWRNGIHD